MDVTKYFLLLFLLLLLLFLLMLFLFLLLFLLGLGLRLGFLQRVSIRVRIFLIEYHCLSEKIVWNSLSKRIQNQINGNSSTVPSECLDFRHVTDCIATNLYILFFQQSCSSVKGSSCQLQNVCLFMLSIILPNTHTDINPLSVL